MKEKVETPSVIWNDRITRVQLCLTLSNKILFRTESLSWLPIDKVRTETEFGSRIWINLPILKKILAALYVRGIITRDAVEDSVARVVDAEARIRAILPQKRQLLSKERVLAQAASEDLSVRTVEEDLTRLKKAGEVFYMAAPDGRLEEKYDAEKALRTAQEEKTVLLRRGNVVAAESRLRHLEEHTATIKAQLVDQQEKARKALEKIALLEVELEELVREREKLALYVEKLARNPQLSGILDNMEES